MRERWSERKKLECTQKTQYTQFVCTITVTFAIQFKNLQFLFIFHSVILFCSVTSSLALDSVLHDFFPFHSAIFRKWHAIAQHA